jgi:hypothetical protein
MDAHPGWIFPNLDFMALPHLEVTHTVVEFNAADNQLVITGCRHKCVHRAYTGIWDTNN